MLQLFIRLYLISNTEGRIHSKVSNKGNISNYLFSLLLQTTKHGVLVADPEMDLGGKRRNG